MRGFLYRWAIRLKGCGERASRVRLLGIPVFCLFCGPAISLGLTLWIFIGGLLEAARQKKSRKYASLNAGRLPGNPSKSLNTGTAPVWTAYGREGSNE
jgi:hypothetical protein